MLLRTTAVIRLKRPLAHFETPHVVFAPGSVESEDRWSGEEPVTHCQDNLQRFYAPFSGRRHSVTDQSSLGRATRVVKSRSRVDDQARELSPVDVFSTIYTPHVYKHVQNMLKTSQAATVKVCAESHDAVLLIRRHPQGSRRHRH